MMEITTSSSMSVKAARLLGVDSIGLFSEVSFGTPRFTRFFPSRSYHYKFGRSVVDSEQQARRFPWNHGSILELRRMKLVFAV